MTIHKVFIKTFKTNKWNTHKQGQLTKFCNKTFTCHFLDLNVQNKALFIAINLLLYLFAEDNTHELLAIG